MSTIIPNQINLFALPSLPLTHKRSLPHCPAIYFVLNGTEVAYIGRTNSLLLRWQAHHKLKELKSLENPRIAWIEIDDKTLAWEIEAALIDWFKPNFNGDPLPGYVKAADRKAVQQSKVKIRCRLQDLIDAQGMTRSALATATGLTSAAIRGLCENTAKRYDVDTLAVLCDFFGCDMSILFEVVPICQK